MNYKMCVIMDEDSIKLCEDIIKNVHSNGHHTFGSTVRWNMRDKIPSNIYVLLKKDLIDDDNTIENLVKDIVKLPYTMSFKKYTGQLYHADIIIQKADDNSF